VIKPKLPTKAEMEAIGRDPKYHRKADPDGDKHRRMLRNQLLKRPTAVIKPKGKP
jgi:hypothetical protein